MRKLDFCLCENEAADQLCSNCTADQRLCFHLIDSTMPLLSKSEISTVWPSSRSCTGQFVSEARKTGFLPSGLICTSMFDIEVIVTPLLKPGVVILLMFVTCFLQGAVEMPAVLKCINVSSGEFPGTAQLISAFISATQI